MKKTLVASAIAVALTLGLTGCDDSEARRQAEAERIMELEIENQALKDAMATVNAEKQELAEFVKEMQEEDPLVQDAYYQSDDKGDRTLVIVRADSTNPSQVVHHSYAGVPPSSSGMGTGFLMGWMMGSIMTPNYPSPMGYGYGSGGGSVTNIYNNTTTTNSYSADESRKRKSVATSAYVSKKTTAARTSIKSNPSKMSAIKTKSQGAISRSTSTTSRASSFSSRGGS